jgi:hypothetical protein
MDTSILIWPWKIAKLMRSLSCFRLFFLSLLDFSDVVMGNVANIVTNIVIYDGNIETSSRLGTFLLKTSLPFWLLFLGLT